MDDREALLSELGAALHQATLPADAVEERLTAVAKRLGLEGHFFTLQSFFAMELRNGTKSVLRLLRIETSPQAQDNGFFRVVLVALQLALGLLVAGLLFRKRRA